MTGSAIYMESDEYVSCELYYLKSGFNEFSVAIQLGIESGKGLPLWALILIILGAFLALLGLLLFLLKNKKFREMLRKCCKPRIKDNAKLNQSNSSSLHPGNEDELLELNLDNKDNDKKDGSSNSDPDEFNDKEKKLDIRRKILGIKGPNDGDFLKDNNNENIKINMQKNGGQNLDDVEAMELGASIKKANLGKQIKETDDVDQLIDNNKNIKLNNQQKNVGQSVDDVEAMELGTSIKKIDLKKKIGIENREAGDVDEIEFEKEGRNLNLRQRKRMENEDNDVDEMEGLKITGQNKLPPLYHPKNLKKQEQEDVDELNPNLNINLYQKTGKQNNEDDEIEAIGDGQLKIKGKVFEYKKGGNNQSDNDVPEISDANNQLRLKLQQKQKNNLMNDNDEDILEIKQDNKIEFNGIDIKQEQSFNDLDQNDEMMLELNNDDDEDIKLNFNQRPNQQKVNYDDLENHTIENGMININLQQKKPKNQNKTESNDVDEMMLEEADYMNINQPLQFSEEDFELDDKDDVDGLATNIFKMYRKTTGRQELNQTEVDEIKNEILAFFEMASMNEIDDFKNINFNNLEEIDNRLFQNMCNYLNKNIFQKQKEHQMLPDNEVENNQDILDFDVQIKEVPTHFFAEERLKSNLVIQELQNQKFSQFCSSQEIIHSQVQKNQTIEQQQIIQKGNSNLIIQEIIQQEQISEHSMDDDFKQELNNFLDSGKMPKKEQQMQQEKVIGIKAEKLMDTFYSKLLTSLQQKDNQRKSTVFGSKQIGFNQPQKKKTPMDSIEQYQQNFINSRTPFKSQFPTFQLQQKVIQEEEEEDEILKQLPKIKQEQGLESMMVKHKHEPFHQKKLVHAGLISANQETFMADLQKNQEKKQ